MARYVLKKGDTLGELAKKFGGSKSYWRAIREANPSLNKGDIKGGLLAGKTIKIPNKILTPDGRAALKRTQARREPGKVYSGDTRIDLGPEGKQAQDALLSDPQYQAYLRYSGLEEARLKDEVQWRTDEFNRTINRRAAGFEEEKRQGTENIALGAEERGLHNSGQRMTQQSEYAANVDADRLNFEASQRDALDNMLRTNQQAQAALTLEGEEQALQTRDRIAKTNIDRKI